MNKEQLIADIKAMTVLELADLVKALEEEFGVSATAAVAVAGCSDRASKRRPEPPSHGQRRQASKPKQAKALHQGLWRPLFRQV